MKALCTGQECHQRSVPAHLASSSARQEGQRTVLWFEEEIRRPLKKTAFPRALLTLGATVGSPWQKQAICLRHRNTPSSTDTHTVLCSFKMEGWPPRLTGFQTNKQKSSQECMLAEGVAQQQAKFLEETTRPSCRPACPTLIGA